MEVVASAVAPDGIALLVAGGVAILAMVALVVAMSVLSGRRGARRHAGAPPRPRPPHEHFVQLTSSPAGWYRFEALESDWYWDGDSWVASRSVEETGTTVPAGTTVRDAIWNLQHGIAVGIPPIVVAVFCAPLFARVSPALAVVPLAAAAALAVVATRWALASSVTLEGDALVVRRLWRTDVVRYADVRGFDWWYGMGFGDGLRVVTTDGGVHTCPFLPPLHGPAIGGTFFSRRALLRRRLVEAAVRSYRTHAVP
jgi:hypothetical protein